MTRCPEGHDSDASDYCDTCGVPMAAGGSGEAFDLPPAPQVPGTPTPSWGEGTPLADPAQQAEASTCPHCSARNTADNLFCEVCGFDFTTGVMPRVEGGEPSFLDLPTPRTDDESTPPPSPDVATPPPLVEERAKRASRDHPEETGEPAPTPDDDAPASHERPTPPLVEERAKRASRDHPEASEEPDLRARKPVNRPPSREVAGDWVVEVWIDPAWYAVQEAMEACPSPAPPEVIPVRGSDALIGRRSRSSTPDIDCGVDAAVSRRQALLTSDGRRWWVEDLDSSNGTWVGPAIGPLPIEPISARTEIDADDRIYVGAWTRLVLRPATPGDL